MIGALFLVTLVFGIVALSRLTQQKATDKDLEKAARAQQFAVVGFTKDLKNKSWIVILVGAPMVALDKHYGIFGGLMNSKLVLGIAIVAIFVVRAYLRRSPADQSPGN